MSFKPFYSFVLIPSIQTNTISLNEAHLEPSGTPTTHPSAGLKTPPLLYSQLHRVPLCHSKCRLGHKSAIPDEHESCKPQLNVIHIKIFTEYVYLAEIKPLLSIFFKMMISCGIQFIFLFNPAMFFQPTYIFAIFIILLSYIFQLTDILDVI